MPFTARGGLQKPFAAFSQQAMLQSWWGPVGFTNAFEEFDFRSGGLWRLTMVGPDGSEHRNESYFVEIAFPERIVFHHGGPPTSIGLHSNSPAERMARCLLGGCFTRRALSARNFGRSYRSSESYCWYGPQFTSRR